MFPRPGRTLLSGISVAGVLLVAAAPAAASKHCPKGHSPHGGNSEIQQYLESVPGACGNQSFGEANAPGQQGGISGGGGPTSGGPSAGGPGAQSGSAGSGSAGSSSSPSTAAAAAASVHRLGRQGRLGATAARVADGTAPPGGPGSGRTGSGTVTADEAGGGSALGAVGTVSPGLLVVALGGAAGLLAFGLLRRRSAR